VHRSSGAIRSTSAAVITPDCRKITPSEMASKNVATGLVLDGPHDAERGTWPVLWSEHSGVNQQRLLVMPFAAPAGSTA
ncbi:hypothetical protein ACWCV2_14200, partial [Streptomyces pseudogriseolus]